MNSYSFHETRRNSQTAWKVTFNLSFFSPVTHYKQDGSLSSYLSNDSKSKSVCNQRKGDKMDGTPFLKQGSFSSASVTRCRMLLIASMQWILTNELLRRCKELANLTSLYFTGPNQRVSKATTSIFYKHGGSKIQTA